MKFRRVIQTTFLQETQASIHQQRSAACFWWIEKYRELGDQQAVIDWQHLHAEESRKARIWMEIE